MVKRKLPQKKFYGDFEKGGERKKRDKSPNVKTTIDIRKKFDCGCSTYEVIGKKGVKK